MNCKLSIIRGVLPVTCLSLLLLGLALRSSAQIIKAGELNFTADPINETDKFAWELFIHVNKPVDKETRMPQWETWAADADVFCKPRSTPVWADGQKASQQEKIMHFEKIIQFEMFKSQRSTLISDAASISEENSKITAKAVDEPVTEQQVFLNRATFDYIVKERLWFVEGQEERFRAFTPINFPKDSIEVKALWVRDTAIPTAKDLPPHCRMSGGINRCLIAFHITSKATPNWIWATFEYEGNRERCKVLNCSDNFGSEPSRGRDTHLSNQLLQMFEKAGLANEWMNYRLDLAQADFIESTGIPTFAGNSVLEKRFISSSSCITCHARSSVNGIGQRLRAFNCPPTQGNPNPTTCENPMSFNGSPDPRWFFDPLGQPSFLQLDFVWALSKAGSSISGCPAKIMKDVCIGPKYEPADCKP